MGTKRIFLFSKKRFEPKIFWADDFFDDNDGAERSSPNGIILAPLHPCADYVFADEKSADSLKTNLIIF